ncbi:hypothetical protein Peur_053721 [Populus x canadensis]
MHQFLQRKYMSIPGFGERKPVVVLTSSAVRELCFATRFLPALLFLSPHAAFLCISISCQRQPCAGNGRLVICM